MAVKRKLLNKIGFLKWVELSPKDVEELPCGCDIGRVFLSPDVKSLHIIWEDGDGIAHEIADYDEGATVREFLEEEVGDDSWETLEDEKLEDLINEDDYSGQKLEDVPVVTIEELS